MTQLKKSTARPVSRLQFYKSADGWRWRFVAANGNTLADGGQGYSRLLDARAGAATVLGIATSGDRFTRAADELVLEVGGS